MLTRKEKHKILLVLTDGYPCHNGLGHPRLGYDWAQKQLKDALVLIRKAGISDIGVGINSPHVQEFYENTLVVNDLEGFGPALVGLVRKAVRGR